MKAKKYTTLTVQFGAVSLEVGLYPPQPSGAAVPMRLLCPTDKVPVKQRYVCEKCGELHTQATLVKGLPWGDEFCVFGQDQLREMKRQTELEFNVELVPYRELETFEFRNSYRLVPEHGSVRYYDALARTLSSKDLIAVGAYVMRSSEYVGALVPEVVGARHRLRLQNIVHPAMVYDWPDMPPLNSAGSDVAQVESLLEGMRTDAFKAVYTAPPQQYAEAVQEYARCQMTGAEWVDRRANEARIMADELFRQLSEQQHTA